LQRRGEEENGRDDKKVKGCSWPPESEAVEASNNGYPGINAVQITKSRPRSAIAISTRTRVTILGRARKSREVVSGGPNVAGRGDFRGKKEDRRISLRKGKTRGRGGDVFKEEIPKSKKGWG